MQDIDKAMAVWLGIANIPTGSEGLSGPPRRMRYNRRHLSDSRGLPIVSGDRLFYEIDGLRGEGKILADPVFRGGLKCNDMSVLSIIEDAEWTQVV